MPGKGRPFKVGESGNPNGRPKNGETITDILKETLYQKVDTKEGKVEIRKLFCKKLIELALKGNIPAIKLIIDHIEGLPLQKVESRVENVNQSPFAEAIEKLITNNGKKPEEKTE